ncbi:MAG TPA: histidine phosphatase family protein [Phenylobacterium sp.]|nr:histidine phosphatase family protein [Phenylobacterium sp.]
MTIYLVRHGETEWNLVRRAQGRLDSPLTPLGVRQAQAMAELLADLIARDPPASWRLISSPLGRAQATAAIIGERLALPVSLDDRLREHTLGDLDGLQDHDLIPRFRTDVPSYERHFHEPSGESLQSIIARVGDFLAGIGDDDRLIVVSHGETGRILRGVYAGLDRQAMLTSRSPQDAVFRLMNGQVDRFACEPLD